MQTFFHVSSNVSDWSAVCRSMCWLMRLMLQIPLSIIWRPSTPPTTSPQQITARFSSSRTHQSSGQYPRLLTTAVTVKPVPDQHQDLQLYRGNIYKLVGLIYWEVQQQITESESSTQFKHPSQKVVVHGLRKIICTKVLPSFLAYIPHGNLWGISHVIYMGYCAHGLGRVVSVCA